MKVKLGQRLGTSNFTYVRRWILECRWFSVRLHHWLDSDDLRNPHDHAWDFWSFVLKGQVWDQDERGQRTLRKRWSLTKFNAEHRHSVYVEDPAWTLIVTGPVRRQWGYWVDGKFRKRNKYFFEHGHHAYNTITLRKVGLEAAIL